MLKGKSLVMKEKCFVKREKFNNELERFYKEGGVLS